MPSATSTTRNLALAAGVLLFILTAFGVGNLAAGRAAASVGPLQLVIAQTGGAAIGGGVQVASLEACHQSISGIAQRSAKGAVTDGYCIDGRSGTVVSALRCAYNDDQSSDWPLGLLCNDVHPTLPVPIMANR